MGDSTSQKQGQPNKKSCYSCGVESSHPRSEWLSKKVTCYKCIKEGHYSSVYRCQGKNFKVHGVQAQPATAQYQNNIPEEYTELYFNADVHNHKAAAVKNLNSPRPEPPIRSLWLSKELSSQFYHIYCEVATGEIATYYHSTKGRHLLEINILLGPVTVKLIGYNDRQIKNLSSSWCFYTMAMRNIKFSVK